MEVNNKCAHDSSLAKEIFHLPDHPKTQKLDLRTFSLSLFSTYTEQSTPHSHKFQKHLRSNGWFLTPTRPVHPKRTTILPFDVFLIGEGYGSEAAATTLPGLESAFRRRNHVRYLVCGLIGLLR